MNQTFIRLTGALLFAAVMAAAGCATVSDVQRLQSQISALEKKNRQLNASVGQLMEDRQKQSDLNEMRELFAGQDAEFYELRSELQDLKGSYEETGYQFQRQFDALEEDMGMLDKKLQKHAESLDVHDKRISRLEEFMGMESTARFEALAQSKFPEKTELGKLSKDELYASAKQAYDNGDFQSALQGFELFLEKFSDSDRADNARFWIGEIYFAEQWYERAILEYEKVIKNYPDGNKVAGAYLKQGFSFEKIGENANARLILNELLEKFPDSNEAKIAKKKLANL
ncbi:tol-pal system protein YbgF [Desulfosalsimonas propionicica]|uniref:Tol-pal system protein YbgF n=1 Tax=Desulfosalsimonas propionicica TaxID=332175 RepID=A0A7W0C8P4_9BACT|nr:tol-pal system protein YbgF [Desulfosalsimonas propionicica]MBA2881234.1 tol-pal system protein YbgF [Desulfosalsimonas propionicica]